MTSRWTVQLIRRLERHGDPEADAVIAALEADEGTEATSELLRTFVANDQPLPASLATGVREYIEAARSLPPWADASKVLQGQRVFERWGPQVGVCLWCQVLAEGYMNWRLSHVIALTGRMETDLKRRAMETFQFLLDVMTPGGLDPTGSGHGIATALRVRLMHAAVRSLVKRRADSALPEGMDRVWSAEWGEPVSQIDLAITLVGLSTLTMDGLRTLGIRLNTDDQEAFFHAWQVVGYYMGIDSPALPLHAREGRELLAQGRSMYYRPTPAGLALEAALIATLEDLAPLPMRGLPRQFIRHLIGDEYANALAVPRIAWWRRFAFRAGGRMHRRTFGVLNLTDLPALAAPMHRAMMKRYLVQNRGGERAAFAIPTELRATFEEPG